MTLTADLHSTPSHTDITAPLRRPLLWLILGGWFALIAALAVTGRFEPASGIVPVALVVAVAMPPLAFLAACLASGRLRAWVARLDLGLVTGTQAWRVVGLAFVMLWLMGELPAAFAIPAGFGDAAVGVAAVFVTIAVVRRTPGWRRASRLLIAAGMLDFAVALAMGVLSNPGGPLAGTVDSGLVLGFPLVLIPAFAVPLFIILHGIAWAKLRQEV